MILIADAAWNIYLGDDIARPEELEWPKCDRATVLDDRQLDRARIPKSRLGRPRIRSRLTPDVFSRFHSYSNFLANSASPQRFKLLDLSSRSARVTLQYQFNCDPLALFTHPSTVISRAATPRRCFNNQRIRYQRHSECTGLVRLGPIQRPYPPS